VAQPKHDHTITPAFPPDLISIIRDITELVCPRPQQPEFFFKLTPEAAKKNVLVLKRHNMNLGLAIAAQQDSPLGYGSEF
jgi:hypothetical protein